MGLVRLCGIDGVDGSAIPGGTLVRWRRRTLAPDVLDNVDIFELVPSTIKNTYLQNILSRNKIIRRVRIQYSTVSSNTNNKTNQISNN